MNLIKHGLVISALSMTMISQPTFSHEGSGVRGGSGHVVDIDSTSYLLDLVTKSVCDWRDQGEILKDAPAVINILDKLAKLDWYFAQDLKKEILSLDFCMTGPLYRQPVSLQPGSVLLPPKTANIRQAAFRLDRQVFIDAEKFAAMRDNNHRGMLIIHEALHSYLSMDTFDRGLKLRSMVKTIDLIRQGKIVTRTKLHQSMRNNEIDFPLTVDALEVDRSAIEFLFADEATQVRKIMAAPAPEKLAALNNEVVINLSYSNQWLLQRKGALGILSEAIEEAIMSADASELVSILDGKTYETLNPAKIALATFKTLESNKQDIVLKSYAFNRIISNGFSELEDASVHLGAVLIEASPEFQALTSNPSADGSQVALINLKPAIVLPKHLGWLTQLLVVLQKHGSLEMITNNPHFYRGLGLKVQKDLVQQMRLNIPRERVTALARLTLLSDALVETLIQSIRLEVDAATAREIEQHIQTERF